MSIPLGSIADGPQGPMMLTDKGWVLQGSPQSPMNDVDSKALADALQQASEKNMLARKSQQFMDDNQNVGTGPIYKNHELPFHLGDINLGEAWQNTFSPKTAAQLQDMDSISNSAWTLMRPQGSGPMRMPEIEGFQQAFPNIANWGPANQSINQRLQTDAQYENAKTKFVQDFINGGRGNFADAVQLWNTMHGAPVYQQQLGPAGLNTANLSDPNYRVPPQQPGGPGPQGPVQQVGGWRPPQGQAAPTSPQGAATGAPPAGTAAGGAAQGWQVIGVSSP